MARYQITEADLPYAREFLAAPIGYHSPCLQRVLNRMRGPAEEALSGREIEVLQLVAKGKSNKEIGKALHISIATVKTHLIHIYAKLGVDDRTAAVTAALERRIISL
mgnify:CR=1 FL=1